MNDHNTPTVAALEDARATIRRLQHEITHMREAAEVRNRQLDALGIVWCSGGCPGGMLRYHPDREVSAQMVADLIVNARRAAAWYVSHKGKQAGAVARAAGRPLCLDDLREHWQRFREEIRALLPPLYADDEALTGWSVDDAAPSREAALSEGFGEDEHRRLADAAEEVVRAVDPDFVGDLPTALSAVASTLEGYLDDPVRRAVWRHGLRDSGRVTPK